MTKPLLPEPADPQPGPLPDYRRAPLETFGVEALPDAGAPAPVRTPHEILLREYEHLSPTVHALIRVLERRGVLTALEVGVERDAVAAEEATDAAVGLIRRLLDEGLIEPLRLRLAQAEHVHPCGCAHAARAAEEDSR